MCKTGEYCTYHFVQGNIRIIKIVQKSTCFFEKQDCSIFAAYPDNVLPPKIFPVQAIDKYPYRVYNRHGRPFRSCHEKRRKAVSIMVKTTLKIDGMMCSMCEAHMNDLVRQNCSVKKVTSSAKNGETVVISEEPLDISMLDKEIKGIGYTLLSHESEPYEKKGLFHRK